MRKTQKVRTRPQSCKLGSLPFPPELIIMSYSIQMLA
jgi:hypothetical protein